MTVWIYNGDIDHPIDNGANWFDSAGTNYPGNYPKGEIAGMSPVVDLDPTGSGPVVTYGSITLQSGQYVRTVTLSAVPVTSEMVQTERSRRLSLGFNYDFGDSRGIVHIGMTAHDMEGWDSVTKLANALIATGNGSQAITIVPEATPISVTALEWMAVLIAAGAAQQPLWQASFVLQAQSPIPDDYTNDSHWN